MHGPRSTDSPVHGIRAILAAVRPPYIVAAAMLLQSLGLVARPGVPRTVNPLRGDIITFNP